jgi:FKBP-type peptidyl-prolyl cis-trans isomerase (trigger factor)
MGLSEETLMDILNLYSTVRIDSEKIRKAFVTVVYPPESAGFGIPKVIVSTEELSEEEIDQNLDDMAKQNARWLTEQAETNPSGFEKLS